MLKVVLLILLVIAIIIGGPIATLWSINTLFPVLAIPYTVETWFAAFILFAGVTGLGVRAKK